MYSYGYIRKTGFKTSDWSFHLKELKKQEQINPNESKRKEINIRAKINKLENG